MSVAFNFENSYARMPKVLFSTVAPQVSPNPQLIIFNSQLAKDLGLGLDDTSEETLADLFSGTTIPKGAEPLAQAYAGHQFGHFTMLGDGRAHLLGEHLTPTGERVDIQLKGSGKTPFARRGDGRAALGPMLREYVISEAMYALGIPTTRSLCVVTTGEPVYRETILPGSVLTRVAASHLRIGTFEYAATRKDKSLLKQLADYAIKRHYPNLEERANPYLALLESFLQRQIDLIVDWMRVGFIHGVMNTDNMTLSGETIDYGPCAFMDVYDPATVFSSIDHMGRYAFANQPKIVKWNMVRFAEAILPLLDDDLDQAVLKGEAILETFEERFEQSWLAMMGRKLGLSNIKARDKALIDDLLDWMQREKADYTNTFVMLMSQEEQTDPTFVSEDFLTWQNRWQKRLAEDNIAREDAERIMQKANPQRIPRNHKVEEALSAAEEGASFDPFNKLLDALSKPYERQEEFSDFSQLPAPQDRVYQTFCGT